MLMRPDDHAVDHHVFIVMIRSKITENPFDYAAFAPAS